MGCRGGTEKAGPETSLVSRSQCKAHRMPFIAHTPFPLEFPFCFSLSFAFLFSPVLAFHQLKLVLQLWFCSWSPFVWPCVGLENSDAYPVGCLPCGVPTLWDGWVNIGGLCSHGKGLDTAAWGPSGPRPGDRTLVVGADGRIWAGADTCRRGCEVRSLLFPLRSGPHACSISLIHPFRVNHPRCRDGTSAQGPVFDK